MYFIKEKLKWFWGVGVLFLPYFSLQQTAQFFFFFPDVTLTSWILLTEICLYVTMLWISSLYLNKMWDICIFSFSSLFFFSIFKTNKEKTPDHKWTRESKRTFPFPTVTGLTGAALSPSPLFDQSHRFPSLPSPSLSLQTWVDMVCVTQVGLSPWQVPGKGSEPCVYYLPHEHGRHLLSSERTAGVQVPSLMKMEAWRTREGSWMLPFSH